MKRLSNTDLLQRVPLFEGLTPRQAAAIAESLVKQRFRRTEAIVRQGENSQTLYIILAGRARVVVSGGRGGRREVILATLHAGDCVGEMNLVDDQPQSATVRAEVATDVLVLQRTAFDLCLAQSPAVRSNLLRCVVQRLRRANQKIESLALQDVQGRVVHALLELATRDEQGRLRVQQRLSRQDLAKRVGASREMVSRVMNDLEESAAVVKSDNGLLLMESQLRSCE